VLRLRANPSAWLERKGTLADVGLAPDPGKRDEVHDLMAAKCGWADTYVGLMANREAALPFRVERKR
jgi:hypothetical protein